MPSTKVVHLNRNSRNSIHQKLRTPSAFAHSILGVCFALLTPIGLTNAQSDASNPYSQLDSIEKLGSLHGNPIENWPFAIKSGSYLLEGLWEHVLPKSVLDGDKIIINRNELDHFLKMDQIQVKTKGFALSNLLHWENRFGKQIQTLEFNKPLHVLVIDGDKLVPLNLDYLEGVQYATYYPKGEFEVRDPKNAPIVYKQQNQLDPRTPVLMVSSHFLEQIDLEKVNIQQSTEVHGTEEYSETLISVGIDFNNDGQYEVLMYRNEIVDDFSLDEGEAGNRPNSIIGMYFENCWYRTSFWQNGQDGVEGF